jgi:hypothetical protein
MEWNLFHRHHHRPTGAIIRQTKVYHRYFNQEGEEIMSTPAGGTSTFQFSYTPTGSIPPAGTTVSWSVDDTADISLAPNPVAPTDTTQVQATCVASPAQTSYNLTATSTYTPPGAPTPISATLNVAIIVTPPLPTGGLITQTS